MQNIKETCISFLQDDNIRKDIKDIIKPITQNIYNEIYIYIWVICLYCMLIMLILLIILVFVIKIIYLINTLSNLEINKI